MAAAPANLRVGIALGAGAARGWAHIGVIRALEDLGVRPAVVCGTSIGALVGAAYAADDLASFEEWVVSLGWRDVLSLVDVTWRGGLIRGRKLVEFFRGRFSDLDIAALRVPFGAIATELGTGREIWLREGSVVEAVRASIAIPGLFTPVWREGRLLVDRGLVNPVPVSMCRALGADVVIAVDLGWTKVGGGRAAGDEMPSMLEVFLSSIDVMEVRVARSRLAGEPADVLVAPMLPEFAATDFHRAGEAIAEGRAAVARMRPLLEHVLKA